MKQSFLWKDPARRLARASDPATSKAGARDAAARLGELQAAALDAVKRWPGHTATELSRSMGYGDPRVFNRRLPELEERGLVVRGAARECTVTGRQAATWWRTTPEEMG